MACAEEMGFTSSCTVEVGRLLRVLASQITDGVIGEIGSGCGVSTAWLASGLLPGAPLVTIEHDLTKGVAVSAIMAGIPNVHVLRGNWRTILHEGLFALLFVDAGDSKQQPDILLPALRPGGIIVLDDLTPKEHWPPEWHGKPDRLRVAWLNRSDVIATELLVTPTSAVIVATRSMVE